MSLGPIFDRFVEQSPISVMFRGLIENVFAEGVLNELFDRHAQRQYPRELMFSTMVDLLSLVVVGTRKSVHAAWKARNAEIEVSVKAVYDKLSGTEPLVSEAFVRETTARLQPLLKPASHPGPLVRGYTTRILDGNHLAGTDRRLKELRRFGAAPLPGMTVAILDPQQQLILEVFTSKDAYESEYTMIPRVLDSVQPGQLWLLDRGFCCAQLIAGVMDRQAAFIVRQHAAHPTCELTGKRRKVTVIGSGVVYEQPVRVRLSDGRVTMLRRITLKLNSATRDGDRELHLLSNLPARISAGKIAAAYAGRWKIETAFQELATVLRSEINTLGYPGAALFGFCLAVVLYNVLSVIRSIASHVHRKQLEGGKLSSYYLSDEIAGTARGMEIAIPQQHWNEAFGSLSTRQMQRVLHELAKHVRIAAFKTNPWTPKQPQPKRITNRRRPHLSTQRILAAYKQPP
jgi:IS4 transposase